MSHMVSYSIMDYRYGVYNFMDSWSEKNNRMFISNIRECKCNFFQYSHVRMRIEKKNM